jgi:hypothetical protein
MQQIKVFKALETEAEMLERQVNDWLAKSGVKVLQISGNIAPQSEGGGGRSGGLANTGGASDLLLIVLYEKP